MKTIILTVLQWILVFFPFAHLMLSIPDYMILQVRLNIYDRMEGERDVVRPSLLQDRKKMLRLLKRSGIFEKNLRAKDSEEISIDRLIATYPSSNKEEYVLMRQYIAGALRIYKFRILHSINPLRLLDLILFLPSHVAYGYRKILPESLFKIVQVAYWCILVSTIYYLFL